MRLLKLGEDGHPSLTKVLYDNIPPYAILSHTWGDDEDECTFKDVSEGAGRGKLGYAKIRFCGKQAASDGLNHFWIDTCCINKADFTELSEAINSMFRWYRNAAKCYVFLTDVSHDSRSTQINSTSSKGWEPSFRESRWLTRGWTLQELIAPSNVEFFSREGYFLGDKKSLVPELQEITGIPATVLQDGRFTECTIEERISWSRNRTTKRSEDKAYSLLGILGVNLPLIYGEGLDSAFLRLREAANKRAGPGRRYSFSSERSFTDTEKSCISQFKDFDIADYKRLLARPAQDTCRWVLAHPSFRAWLEGADNAILWLTGHPGCGKTILTSFLAKDLERARGTQTPQNVVIYFCDDKINKQKDANAILAGLIFQLIQRRRSMMRHLRKAFDFQGKSLIRSFSALWGIFQNITQDPNLGPLCVIVDALDECEKESCCHFLESIHELATRPEEGPVENYKTLRFLLSSRPSLRQTLTRANDLMKHQIAIDEHQPGHDRDLEIFIGQRVKEISPKLNLSNEVAEFLRQTLYSKSEQTFLWVHTVLSSLETSPLASMKDITAIINTIPSDLETVYLSFLSTIPADYKDTASRLLLLILASSRPLRVDEINIAFTINSLHRSSGEVSRSCQPAIVVTLQGVLGPLVRVTDSRVTLVHLSTKDFLLGTKRNHQTLPVLSEISTETCALEMATACIRYLLLDEFLAPFSRTFNSLIGSNSGSTESTLSSPDSLVSDNFFIPWEDGGLELESDAFRVWCEPETLNSDMCQNLVSKHGFYSYAALNWTQHFAMCEGKASSELKQVVRTLLHKENGCCRNWLRYYSANVPGAEDDNLVELGPIILAAYFNLNDTLRVQLSNNEATQSVMDQALFWASREGHTRTVQTLLECDADPNVRGPENQTSLIAAARHSRMECVRTLLGVQRTDPAVRGLYGRNALSYACGNGNEAVVEELLKRDKTSANDPDRSGATSLFRAAGGGYIAVMNKILTDTSADINHRDNMGRTVISWAAGDGMESVLERLFKVKGIDVNLEDRTGKTPLLWAAGNGCVGAIAILAKRKRVKLGSIDHDKRNAISWACAGGHADALRTLLDKGCPGIDDKDVDGWTPLAWAIHIDSPATILTLLSTEKVDLERRDHSGRTALSWAVEYGHLSVVKVLLEAHADPGTTSDTGKTPISIAETYQREDMLNELRYHLKKRTAKER